MKIVVWNNLQKKQHNKFFALCFDCKIYRYAIGFTLNPIKPILMKCETQYLK